MLLCKVEGDSLWLLSELCDHADVRGQGLGVSLSLIAISPDLRYLGSCSVHQERGITLNLKPESGISFNQPCIEKS